MKLLICTQVVDAKDPILGFFIRWIEEFAKHCERVDVICLRQGEHSLPANVFVHSLGKESGVPRVLRWARALSYSISLRSEYEAVFVHMNPEYLILCGAVWRAMKKKTALWYTHKSVNWRLRSAVRYADIVFTASKESFRLPSNKLLVMGHGIDTDFFSPDPAVVRSEAWLSVGRLMKSKRHDIIIREAARAGRELRIAGDGQERGALEALAHVLHADVHFLGGISQAQLRDEYRRAALFVHRSETGSLDKVVLEAAACGLPVESTDPAIAATPVAKGDFAYVREHHSLSKLVAAILENMQKI